MSQPSDTFLRSTRRWPTEWPPTIDLEGVPVGLAQRKGHGLVGLDDRKEGSDRTGCEATNERRGRKGSDTCSAGRRDSSHTRTSSKFGRSWRTWDRLDLYPLLMFPPRASEEATFVFVVFLPKVVTGAAQRRQTLFLRRKHCPIPAEPQCPRAHGLKGRALAIELGATCIDQAHRLSFLSHLHPLPTFRGLGQSLLFLRCKANHIADLGCGQGVKARRRTKGRKAEQADGSRL
jgi:hypothetical protein